MDKLHERKMNDSYKSPNGKCHEKFEYVKKFELVECSKQIRIYNKHDGQNANFINVETDFINAEK